MITISTTTFAFTMLGFVLFSICFFLMGTHAGADKQEKQNEKLRQERDQLYKNWCKNEGDVRFFTSKLYSAEQEVKTLKNKINQNPYRTND